MSVMVDWWKIYYVLIQYFPGSRMHMLVAVELHRLLSPESNHIPPACNSLYFRGKSHVSIRTHRWVCP